MPGIYGIIMTIIAIVSVVINIIFFVRGIKEPKIGTLNISTSENGKDLYSFDISIPLDDIPKKRHIRMDVNVHRTVDM